MDSVRHCLYTLRRLLAPNYAVIPVTGDMIIKEPWAPSCAAVVFPGGADQGYCRTLNGEGNRRIRQFVERGGVYIGFCAGGYYGSQRCEFEVGDKYLEVVGERELGFYPGTARGCAFAGFVYNSEKGARAVEMKVNKAALSSGSVPSLFRTYYNGGSVFVDAPKLEDKGVTILASYTEKLSVDPGEGAAAVVYCKVGEGAAILTGPHPEFVFFGNPIDNWSLTKPRFAPAILEEKPDIPGFSDLKKRLAEDEKHRMDFLKACLTKLGLTVSHEQNVPPLSRMYMSSYIPSNTGNVLSGLTPLLSIGKKGEDLLEDSNDTFHIVKPSKWSMVDLTKALPTKSTEQSEEEDVANTTITSSDSITDYNTIIKQILFNDTEYPEVQTTPYFNHELFYACLKHHQSRVRLVQPTFGNHLLYGEVVTSTNTLLEKNTKLLCALPQGFTMTATTQVAARGRGSNVWISPPGSLIFSTVIRYPMSLMQTAPVVFVQYLAAMAVVDGIKNYDGNLYKNMPIKLKWPNDIYALDPVKFKESGDRNENYVKMGGILVNSHYSSSEYLCVCGIGLNVANALPTISLNQLVPLLPSLLSQSQTRSASTATVPPPTFTLEPLLASILTSFESIYTRFLSLGFDPVLQQQYYDNWLHMDQIVTLETEGGARARIKGITTDYGMLVAEELGWQDRSTGRRFELMSDNNSFDFFNGLVKRKI